MSGLIVVGGAGMALAVGSRDSCEAGGRRPDSSCSRWRASHFVGGVVPCAGSIRLCASSWRRVVRLAGVVVPLESPGAVRAARPADPPRMAWSFRWGCWQRWTMAARERSRAAKPGDGVARNGRDSSPDRGPPRAGKNVILIVLDTVRADRLGVYGYERDTTPNLARLASRGVRFARAFSTAPWTAPSHASLFTGRWPHELSIGWDRPLDSTHATLAEVLAADGYLTAGFVANTTYCSYETGLDRGFAHYEDYDVTLRGVLLCSSLVERTMNFVHKHPGLAGPGWGLGRDFRRRPQGRREDQPRLPRLGRRPRTIRPTVLRVPELLRRPPPLPRPRPRGGCPIRLEARLRPRLPAPEDLVGAGQAGDETRRPRPGPRLVRPLHRLPRRPARPTLRRADPTGRA